MKDIFENLNELLNNTLEQQPDDVLEELEVITAEFAVLEKFIGAKFKLDIIEWYFLKKDLSVPDSVKQARVKFHQDYEQLQIQAGKREKDDTLTPPDITDMNLYAEFIVQKEKEYAVKLMSLDPDPKSKNPVNVAGESALALEIRNMYGGILIKNTDPENAETRKNEFVDESSKIMLGAFIYIAAIKKRIGDVPGSTTLKAYCKAYCRWMDKKLPQDILEYFFANNPGLDNDKTKEDYKNYYRSFIPKRDKDRGWGSELDSYRIYRTRK